MRASIAWSKSSTGQGASSDIGMVALLGGHLPDRDRDTERRCRVAAMVGVAKGKPEMTAEDKMSRAWRTVIIAALVAVLAATGFVVWMFWSIAGYVS